MGIFDKFKGSKDVQLTPKSALALAAMTMLSADGVVEDEELESLTRIVKGDGNAFDLAFKVYKDKSASECVQLVSNVLDDKQKLATVAVLLDIAMVDGILAGDEKNLIQAYVDSFRIAEEAVEAIVEVIAIKNDFSAFM